MTQTTKLYETEDESKSITGNFSYSLVLLFIPSASTSVTVHCIALDKIPNVKKKKQKNKKTLDISYGCFQGMKYFNKPPATYSVSTLRA